MPLPEPVEKYLAEAPRLFHLRVVEVELVERGDTEIARVSFGPGEGRAWFHRDFPLIDAPRVGSRWSVTLQPEAARRLEVDRG